jgi:hypothetical protein
VKGDESIVWHDEAGTGVAAVLSLRSDVAIPADLDAEVHSVLRSVSSTWRSCPATTPRRRRRTVTSFR